MKQTCSQVQSINQSEIAYVVELLQG